MARLTRLLVPAVLLASIVAATVGIAVADVDPASDVLLLQNVFVPYQPKVCSEVKKALVSATDKSHAAGYPLKVAVVGSKNDLGGAPQYFGNPTAYAKFLGQELAVYGPDVGRDLSTSPLLVAMPQGWGLYQVDPPANSVVTSIKIPPKADPNALARAAIEAVPKVATAAGHPTPSVKVPSGCSSSGTNVLVFAVPIAVLILGGLVLGYGLRPRRPEEPSS
jgi:hypothetical protein